MEDLVCACESALGTSTLRGRDALFVADMLLGGLAWAYTHRGDLTRALTATQRGIELAEHSPHGHLLVARGQRALGYLHRALAETSTSSDTINHLRHGKKAANTAYRALRRMNQPTHEVGQALHVRALLYFADFQLRGRWTSLWLAGVLAHRTTKNFPPANDNERLARLLLRAEIATIQADTPLALKLAGQVNDLVEEREANHDGRPGADITARRRLVRAQLFYCEGTGAVHIAEDAEAALKIFEENGMPLRAAAAKWLLIKVDHHKHLLTDNDIHTLETLTHNPAERILAVTEDTRRRQDYTKRRRRRTAEWRDIMRSIRRRGPGDPPEWSSGDGEPPSRQ